MKIGLETLKGWVEDYLDATQEHRNRAATRRDYRCGIQWTDNEITELGQRKQPVITYNYVGEKVGTMVGAEVVGRTVPNAVGRNAGADQATASVATAAIRYVTDEADWDGERTAGREQLFVEGVVGTEILVEQPEVTVDVMVGPGGAQAERIGSQGNPQITLNHIPYDRLFWDPHSRFDDFRDAKYYGTIVWMDLDDAQARWPAYAEQLELSVSTSSTGDEDHDDKPTQWISGGKRKRIKAATIWFRVADIWQYAEFCGYTFLEAPRISPFVDDRNRRIPGMVLRSALTSRGENERIGPVQDLISPQDEVNKRRSKALHLMNSKQILAQEGAFRDLAEARRQLHMPDGIVTFLPNRQVQIVDHQAQVVENLQLLQDARSAFETIGPSEALSGQAAGAGASGVAIERRQAGAMLRFGNYLHNATRWELQVYRHIWFRIRQYWQAEDFVRITEDESSAQYLEVNKPVTVADELINRGVDPAMLQQLNASGQLAQMGIDLAQVMRVDNHLQQLDVDIIIDSRPASPTYRHDQIAAVADMLGKLPLPPESASVGAEIILEMVDLDPRIKNRFMEKLQPNPQMQAMQAQVAQQQQAMAQQVTQMQMAKMEADIQKTLAEVERIKAQAETEETDAIANIAKANKDMASAQENGYSPTIAMPGQDEPQPYEPQIVGPAEPRAANQMLDNPLMDLQPPPGESDDGLLGGA